MTKQEIEALKPGDIIYCPFTGQKWFVYFWRGDENDIKNKLVILIVENIEKTYKWFLTKEQLKRYIKIKE